MDPLMKIAPYLTREEHEVSSKNDEQNSAEVTGYELGNAVASEVAMDAGCLAMNDGVRSSHYRKRWEPEVRTILAAALPALRRQIAEEIAQAAEADTVYDTAARYHFAHIAREIATRTTDARTDPFGYTLSQQPVNEVWVYRDGGIDQVLPEFNPDLNMLAGMYPDAIYFYATLVIV